MPWFRIAVAEYPKETSNEIFKGEPEERIPRHVALETSQNLEDPNAVSLIYYVDIENMEECGDFFFESVQDALEWCSTTLNLNPTEFIFLDPVLDLNL